MEFLFFLTLLALGFAVAAYRRVGKIEDEYSRRIGLLEADLHTLKNRASGFTSDTPPEETREETTERESPPVPEPDGVPEPEWPIQTEPERTPEPEPEATPQPQTPVRPVTEPGPSWWAGVFDRWETFKQHVDWEHFTGIKLFAWIGGAALSFGAMFFIKYSIDNNLIPPQVRLAIGAFVGMGLIVWSLVIKNKTQYAMTIHALAAGGVAVLYTVSFASTSYYQYIPKSAGFPLISLVSAAAFVLAVYHQGRFISVLGLLGAYATPLLVNTGQGNIYWLFVYLTMVNAGVFQVMKRMVWTPLLPLATLGTLLVLSTWEGLAPHPTPYHVLTEVALANLALFSWVINRYRGIQADSQAIRFSGAVLFLSQILLSFLLTDQPGPYPLILVGTSTLFAIGLAFWEGKWSTQAINYGVIGFVTVMYWALRHFHVEAPSWDMAFFLAYGVVGGLGPLVLIQRHGVDLTKLRWLQVFPIAVAAIGLAVLIKSPVSSVWFWPMLVGLNAIGMLIGLVVGSAVHVVALTALLVISGLVWITRTPWLAIDLGFYFVVLVIGGGLCALLLWFIKRLGEWRSTGRMERLASLAPSNLRVPLEALGAFPVMGPFVLLSVILMRQDPLTPNPAMATALCLGGIAIFLAKRTSSQVLLAVSLAAVALAESSWGARVVPGDLLNYVLLEWSTPLWVSALALPVLVFRSEQTWPVGWYAWAMFEMAQALFMIKAMEGLWDRQIMGWLPLGLAALKLPVVKWLLVRLEGKPERNAILAFHGAALLLYLSSVPVLLFDRSWLGVTFVIESMALLWLNRRIEHPGLRWVSLILAPAGLILLLGHFPELRHAEDLPVVNQAVLSLAVCTAALAMAVRWAASPIPHLQKIHLPSYFRWLAIATGFALLNVIVSDLFGLEVQRLDFLRNQTLHHWISYSLLWGFFGALLWRMDHWPKGFRVVGLILLILGWGRVLWMAVSYAQELALMGPVVNVAFIAFVLLLVALGYLIRKEQAPAEKSLFLTMALILGLVAITVELATIFQGGAPLIIGVRVPWPMALATSAAWFVFGGGLVLWPRTLPDAFRSAGAALILVSLYKAVVFPVQYAEDFGAMAAIFNAPTAVYLLILTGLLTMAWTQWGALWRWPADTPGAQVFWAVVFTLTAFYVTNVEVASCFGTMNEAGERLPFSFSTFGRLSRELAYSLSWMLFALGVLIVGLKKNLAGARWAALGLFAVTVLKVFFKDLASLSQLYRVTSLIGLAAILLFVSFLYQRQLSKKKP